MLHLKFQMSVKIKQNIEFDGSLLIFHFYALQLYFVLLLIVSSRTNERGSLATPLLMCNLLVLILIQIYINLPIHSIPSDISDASANKSLGTWDTRASTFSIETSAQFFVGLTYKITCLQQVHVTTMLTIRSDAKLQDSWMLLCKAPIGARGTGRRANRQH